MIYLDTHVVVWLYAGLTEKLSEQAKSLINKNDCLISPIVKLELQYLYEIGRITAKPDEIITDLSKRMGLKVCDKDFASIVDLACTITWTRDPFDRMIVANATLHKNLLLTKDQTIVQNSTVALW